MMTSIEDLPVDICVFFNEFATYYGIFFYNKGPPKIFYFLKSKNIYFYVHFLYFGAMTLILIKISNAFSNRCQEFPI